MKQVQQRVFGVWGCWMLCRRRSLVLKALGFDHQFRQYCSGVHERVDEFFDVTYLFLGFLGEFNAHPHVGVHDANHPLNPQIDVGQLHGEDDPCTNRER